MFKKTQLPIQAQIAAAAKSKFVKKQSKIVPFESQIIHNYSEIGLKSQLISAESTFTSFNDNKVNVLARISKIDTKNHKFPRIIKEYDIILGNKVLTIRDMFTSIPSTLNDEINSMMQQSVVNTSDSYGISFKLNNLTQNFDCTTQPINNINQYCCCAHCQSCCALQAKQQQQQSSNVDQCYVDLEDQTTDDDDTHTTTTDNQACVFKCDGTTLAKESSSNISSESSRTYYPNEYYYQSLGGVQRQKIQQNWHLQQQPQQQQPQSQQPQEQSQQQPQPSQPSLQMPLPQHYMYLMHNNHNLNNNNPNNNNNLLLNNQLLLQRKLAPAVAQQQQQQQIVVEQQKPPVGCIQIQGIESEQIGGGEEQGGEEGSGEEGVGKGKISECNRSDSFRGGRKTLKKPFKVFKKQIRKVPSRRLTSNQAQDKTTTIVEKSLMVSENV